MDYQRIMLIGNTALIAVITKPKGSVKYSRYADFTLIVRNRAGAAAYYPIRCLGKLAEWGEIKTIGMGTRIFVEGEPEITEHTRKHGSNCMSLRVVATTLRILSSRRHNERSRPKKSKRAGSLEMSDEELPF